MSFSAVAKWMPRARLPVESLMIHGELLERRAASRAGNSLRM